VAARSKAWVYGLSLVGIVGSNPAGGMDVCLCWVLSLGRADHSSREVLPTVMRRYVWSRNLKNEEALARVGPQRHREEKNLNPEATHSVAAICTVHRLSDLCCCSWKAVPCRDSGEQAGIQLRSAANQMQSTAVITKDQDRLMTLSLTSYSIHSFTFLHFSCHDVIAGFVNSLSHHPPKRNWCKIHVLGHSTTPYLFEVFVFFCRTGWAKEIERTGLRVIILVWKHGNKKIPAESIILKLIF